MLQNISAFSTLIPLGLFIVFFKKNNKKDLRVILFYCICSFITDLLIINLNNSLHPKRGFYVFQILSLFTIIEYSLFSLFIYLSVKTSLFKKLILSISPLFYFFVIVLYLRSSNNLIDSLSITFESLLIITYCIFYFFEEINKPETTFIYSSYRFWIVTSILIYLTGTFFFFMQGDSLSDTDWDNWKAINHLCTIFKNILFGIGFIMSKKNTYTYDEKPYEDIFKTPLKPL